MYLSIYIGHNIITAYMMMKLDHYKGFYTVTTENYQAHANEPLCHIIIYFHIAELLIFALLSFVGFNI